jgi:hypothetical protein
MQLVALALFVELRVLALQRFYIEHETQREMEQRRAP